MTVLPTPVVTTVPSAASDPPRSATTAPVAPWRADERTRVLSRLLAVTADDLDEASDPARRRLLARLIAARDDEVRRRRAGHWSASPLRLQALAEAILVETASLAGRADRTGSRETRLPADAAHAREAGHGAAGQRTVGHGAAGHEARGRPTSDARSLGRSEG